MEYIIDSEYNEVRLDRFLRKHLANIPLTEIFKGIRTGKIKVNNKKSKENYRLKSGDVVKLYFKGEDEKKEDNSQENKEDFKVNILQKEISKIKSSIVYEDKNLLIFNKGADMVMHKGSGHTYGVSEIFKEYLQNSNFNFVNRIDKSTSGLVIGAKNLVTNRELAQDMRDRKIEKKYYILVCGKILKKEFMIRSYLKKLEDKVIELDKYEDGAKESISYFRVIDYGKDCTLLEGSLGSGRTHQLRVQLASMGHHIIGDNKYGKGKERMMYLFSHYLKISRYQLEINLPLPIEFTQRLSK